MFTIRNSQRSSSWHTTPTPYNTILYYIILGWDVKGSVPLSIAGQGVLSLALCFVWFLSFIFCFVCFVSIYLLLSMKSIQAWVRSRGFN